MRRLQGGGSRGEGGEEAPSLVVVRRWISFGFVSGVGSELWLGSSGKTEKISNVFEQHNATELRVPYCNK